MFKLKDQRSRYEKQIGTLHERSSIAQFEEVETGLEKGVHIGVGPYGLESSHSSQVLLRLLDVIRYAAFGLLTLPEHVSLKYLV